MPGSGTRRQSRPKPGRECHHCKQWIAPGEAHDCWTTTESALTRDLPEDLRDAWAEDLHHGAWVQALEEQQRSGRVAEVVKPNPRQTGVAMWQQCNGSLTVSTRSWQARPSA